MNLCGDGNKTLPLYAFIYITQLKKIQLECHSVTSTLENHNRIIRSRSQNIKKNKIIRILKSVTSLNPMLDLSHARA